jgi:outer membrane immunogenic protein
MNARKMIFAAAALAASAVSLGATASPAAAQTFRAEVHGGWDRLTNDVREDGIVYGLGAGVDFRLGRRLTVGAEANADFGNVEECGTGVIATGDELCVEAGRDLSAVARIGVDVTERAMVYALAGYTNGRFRIDYDPANGPATSVSENLDGIRVGAGVQHGFGNGLYSKIEYRYSNYEAGAERHQVIAGLGIAF